MTRLDELKRFYDAMALLEKSCGGKRLLADCDGRMGWPEKGVYFFFEEGENRAHKPGAVESVERQSGGLPLCVLYKLRAVQPCCP